MYVTWQVMVCGEYLKGSILLVQHLRASDKQKSTKRKESNNSSKCAVSARTSFCATQQLCVILQSTAPSDKGPRGAELWAAKCCLLRCRLRTGHAVRPDSAHGETQPNPGEKLARRRY